jgi:hypothetical protein
VTDFPTTFDRDRYERLCAAGMPSGLGTRESACVMAALNLACGGDLTDSAASPCVLPAAAAFAVRLNEAKWSSPTARADGLHDLGLALLGTADIDRTTFMCRLAEGTIRRVLPIALRAAGMTKEADRCEREGTRDAASAAYAEAYASAHADASAAYSASAARTASAASAYADAYAAAAAAYAAASAAAAATYVAHAAYSAAASAASAADYAAHAATSDYVLRVSATLATEILTELRGAL